MFVKCPVRGFVVLDGIKDMICAGFTRSESPLLGIIFSSFISAAFWQRDL